MWYHNPDQGPWEWLLLGLVATCGEQWPETRATRARRKPVQRHCAATCAREHATQRADEGDVRRVFALPLLWKTRKYGSTRVGQEVETGARALARCRNGEMRMSNRTRDTLKFPSLYSYNARF